MLRDHQNPKQEPQQYCRRAPANVSGLSAPPCGRGGGYIAKFHNLVSRGQKTSGLEKQGLPCHGLVFKCDILQ